MGKAQPRADTTDCARMSESVEICLAGPALPVGLTELESPPERLFLRGELPRGPKVAIVGTRQPSERSQDYARALAFDLASAGVAVLSGGATGIDTEAHRGALDARGVTVVVAPAGFERPFPEENAGLFRKVVASGGAYLSLKEAHEPATRGIFFARNAVLVALAHLVVVVESPVRSGARNAAATARRLGRPLFVVPHAPWHGRGSGCLAELKLGARLLQSEKDLFKVLRELHLHAVSTPPEPSRAVLPQQQNLSFPESSTPTTARAAVLSALHRGAATADEICLDARLPAACVSELILTLRLEGVLVTHPSGRLQISKLLI